MITYSVNCMVGKMFGGIPSFDVAVSMAIDFCRYPITDEYYEDEDTLERAEVTVEKVSEDDIGIEYTLVSSEHQHRGLGIGVERWCESCRRVL